MNKHDLISMLGLIALLLLVGAYISGCYIGQAEFRGEDMRVYPLFSTDKGSSNE